MMPRLFVFALTFLVALTLLGCNGREASGKKEGSDASHADENELADVRAKANALRAKMPATDTTPLLDLLSQLPKDLWPKDSSDSLKIEQAEEWYAKNAIGRRVIVTVPSGRKMDFNSEGNGKYSVSAEIRSSDETLKRVSLFGGQFSLHVGAGAGTQFSVNVSGVSTAVAERLRVLPADAPLEVVANLDYVGNFRYGNVVVNLAEGRFKGFEP